MTTPSKSEIETKAIEMFFKDQHTKGFKTSITPELEELNESGYFNKARDELMRSEGYEALDYIEKEANALGYVLKKEKIEEGKQRKPYDFEIDIEEALRSGVFISGGKGTTKSNLAKIIAHRLMKLGYAVKVFDISRAWMRSSIPHYYEIKGSCNITNNLYQSVNYDLSRLTPQDVKKFIGLLLAQEWNMQVNVPEEQRKWIIYVFEETQMLTPQGSLRSNEAQQVLRLMTSGRNFKLGYVAITQRPALCDTSVFELTFQRYFARLDGANDIRKVANYIGIEKARELQNLKLGEFIYDFGSETKWIATEEFKPKKKPIALPTYPLTTQIETKPNPTKKKEPTALDFLIGITSMLAFLMFLVVLIA